jgi:peptidyl-tRNA hydrolase
MRNLASLDPEKFDTREHAALCWVRETLTRKEGASSETAERFEQAFDERHRAYVIATMKSMYFFNLAGNTMDFLIRKLLRRPEYGQEAACPI